MEGHRHVKLSPRFPSIFKRRETVFASLLWVKGLVFLGAILLALLFCLSPWGQVLDRIFFDLFFLLRGSLSQPADVVVVAIDEPSFGAIGKQWPWPRGVHAKVIDNLFEAGAKVVAFDLIFAEPSSPEEDGRLKEAIHRHPNLILASDRNVIEEDGYDQEIVVSPLPEFTTPQTKIGYINLPIDPDGFIRRTKLSSGNLRSFAFLSAHTFCREKLFLNSLNKEDLFINFIGPPRSIKTVSFYQALDPHYHLPNHLFKGKLVFVGLVTHSILNLQGVGKEQYPIPFSRWGKGQMAGVEIHAHIVSNLIQQTFLRQLPLPLAIFIGLILGFLFAFLFLRFNPWLGGFFLTFETIGGFLSAYILFSNWYAYVPVLYLFAPVVVCYGVSLSFHYLEVSKEKKFIRSAFSTYLSPSIVNRLIHQPERLRLGGEKVEATVLFLDIVGFCSFSRQMSPESLILFLNQHLGKFTEIIFQFEGMVDKYIGDGVMAVWGVPVPQPDHGQRACLAALEMGRILRDLSESKEISIGKNLKTRIGINSGWMVAGNVGASRHYNYTVVGSEVNLASRLEGINKIYDTRIIIGENTFEFVKKDFEWRELDLIRLKGQENPLRIYELQGIKGSLDETQKELNHLFQKGLRLYRMGHWAGAREVFEKASLLNEKDGPCHTFKERCLLYEKKPPPFPWDGVFDLTEK